MHGHGGGTCRPATRSQTHISTADSVRLPVLPFEPFRAGGGHGQPLPAALLRGHAIGCERCHGPGELHAADPNLVDGRDLTIVNPAALEPALRDAVCQQCHLNGQKRVLRAGRHDEDFRPGLPFQHFWTVLERPSELGRKSFRRPVRADAPRADASRQARAASGASRATIRIGFPRPRRESAYFRDRCLECHADRGCSLPATQSGPSGDRPTTASAATCRDWRTPDIIHVAETNHRIPRRADEPRPACDCQTGNSDGNLRPWVNFHRDLMNDRELDEAERDVGVAVCLDGPDGAAAALPALEDALAVWPEDVPGWEAKGYALGLLHRDEDGLAAFRKALALEPNRESALTGAAYSAAHAGRSDDAITYWQRAIALSPWRAEYRAELASAYFQGRNWHAATAACREALTLRTPPTSVSENCWFGPFFASATSRQHGLEFETLIAFDPPDRDQLLGWFTSLTKPQ